MAKTAMKIGIVDTMFARVNMGAFALDEIRNSGLDIEVERRTVPGIKDLAVECKKLLDAGCEICMALGMVGGAPIDQQCAHEASLGIQQAKLLTNKHIVEVFVHENEAWNEKEFYEICESRARKHAQNAMMMLSEPAKMVRMAGMGVRQGKEDEGRVNPAREQPVGLAFAVSEFNPEITHAMEKYAAEEAKKAGVEVIRTVWVPGVYDLPLAVKKLLWDKRVHAVVTLGYVKKGETEHDEVVAWNATMEMAGLSLEHRKPVVLGIIGPGATLAQAEERKEDYARRGVNSAVKLVKELRK